MAPLSTLATGGRSRCLAAATRAMVSRSRGNASRPANIAGGDVGFPLREIQHARPGGARHDDDVGRVQLFRQQHVAAAAVVALHVARLHTGLREPRNVHRDHDVRSHGARDLDRHRARDAAVQVRLAVDHRGNEQPRHAGRRANREPGVAAIEHRHAAGPRLGGDHGEAPVQALDRALVHHAIHKVLQRDALHPAVAEQRKVHQVPLLQPEGDLLQLAAATPAGIERGHDRTRARAGHDVRLDACFLERLDHADVGEPARAAAAQHERDHGPLRPQRDDLDLRWRTGAVMISGPQGA
jgi:hypothetical protein